MLPPLLPGTPELHWRDSALHLEGCALVDLADRFGTPLYAYSRAGMLRALDGYRQALAQRDHLICYAVKANSNLAVLQFFAAQGCGFDIVSGGELDRVVAAGGDPAKVVFSGVGKTRAEMAHALRIGVHAFNVESVEELERLSDVACASGRTANVSLRVNPDVDARTHPYISTGLRDNKFGIAWDESPAAYRRAAGLPGLKIVGIDCHIGSQITLVEPYLEALDRVLDLVEALERLDIAIAHLDVGGGLGIAYADDAPPSPAEFVASLLARIDARGHGHRRLLLEPGRSLVGNAGVLVSEVLYVKHGETKTFCIVDAAMNDLVRPAMYDAWMRIVECRIDPATPPRTVDVVGPVCESGDWLGRDRFLAVAAGDRVAVLSAGAYAMCMASNYNSRGRAAEVWIDGATATLIRERETSADVMRGERLLTSR